MQSAAFVVGPEDGAGDALMQLSQEMGFDSVAHYVGPEQPAVQSRQTPICFFMVTSTARKSDISEFVTEIRHHHDRPLRFSPLLFLSEDPSPRTINFCINAGFDDIIAPPFTPERLLDRVMAQIGTMQTYYETSTYFGPDRRFRTANPLEGEQRAPKAGAGAYRRYDIRRDFLRGVSVTSRPEPHASAPN